MSSPGKEGRNWLNPQNTLRLVGGALIIQGLIFYAFAAPLTVQIFPGAGDEALHVGMVMRRSLATMSFLAGLVIFLVREEPDRVAKRVLFGCSIGFSAVALSMLKMLIDKAAVIPLPALIFYSLVAVFVGYLAFRKTH
jgi:hypothetical protein